LDARVEFAKLLKKYGHYVLLARQNKRVVCDCWDDTTKSADPRCEECLGTGHTYVMEKVRCRSQISNIPYVLGKSLESTEAGVIASVSKVFYFKDFIEVGKRDMILECEWSEDTPVLGFYTELFEVNYAEPKRDIDDGRINHIEVHCAREPINVGIRVKELLGKFILALDTQES